MTDWRVVVLENEYLSCRVLPDLGGHLHGCTDRITGREIFYSNPVIRRTTGLLFGIFVTGYGLCRFIVEFFRQQDI